MSAICRNSPEFAAVWPILWATAVLICAGNAKTCAKAAATRVLTAEAGVGKRTREVASESPHSLSISLDAKNRQAVDLFRQVISLTILYV